MTRLDWMIVRRFTGRVAFSIFMIFSLLALVNALDTPRFSALSRVGGPLLGLAGIAANALRFTIGTLAVSVLIGTILCVIDLQARRELTIIKSTGLSIWAIMKGPLLVAAVFGALVATVGDAASIALNRAIPYSGRASSGQLMLEQNAAGGYILKAQRWKTGGAELSGVTVYFKDPAARARLVAEAGRLQPGHWELTNVTRYRVGQLPEKLASLTLDTETTLADMRVRTTSAADLTVFELISATAGRIAEPSLWGSAMTTLIKHLVLPAMLCGSVLIGFAFTAGYRRANRFGGMVLYGVVLGFVVYVLTELASRAGIAGVLDPAFAAAGPAFLAIVTGVTVLLYREDGRA